MQNEMRKGEAVEMMKRASAEIKALRGEIARLAPMAEAYEQLRTVLGLLPKPSRGMGEDVAWMLDRRIAELTAPPAKEEPVD